MTTALAIVGVVCVVLIVYAGILVVAAWKRGDF